MALVYSPPAEKGKVFSDFQLMSVEGQSFDTQSIPNTDAVVLMFICNHCPYVKAIEDRLIELGNSFKTQAVRLLAICSNDPTDHPEDRPEELLKRSKEKAYPFVYLVDSDQKVAKTFDAVCTPDFFVFGPAAQGVREIYYRGRLDDSWKDSARVSQKELSTALSLLLKNEPAPVKQIPSMGCSIKWRGES